MRLNFLSKISLRVKLLILFVALITVTSGPIVYFNYADALKNAEKVALLEFSNQLHATRDRVQFSYLYAQADTNSRGVLLREIADSYLTAFRGLVRDGDTQSIEYERRFGEKFGFGFAQYSTQSGSGEWIYRSATADMFYRVNPPDPRGYYFRDFFDKPYKLPYGTRYDGFVYVPNEDGRPVPYFYVIFRTKTETFVFTVDISMLEYRSRENFTHVAANARDILYEFQRQSPEHKFAVLDTQGKVIASRGTTEKTFTIPKDIQATLESKGEFFGVQTTSEGEEFLYGVVRINGVNWYTASVMPTSVLRESVYKHILMLLVIALGLSSVVCLLGLLFFMRMLSPLGRLSQSASDFSKLDFSADDLTQKASAIVAKIPTKYNDEIGQVGKAFGMMVTTIEENVTLLKQTLSIQQHIEGELRAAHDIQMQILPVEKDGFAAKHFSAQALIVPAREVGGDFFDVMDTPDGRQALIIGDVSGKGVSAALFMCVALTLIRNAITQGLSAAAAMDTVNKVLAIKNSTCMFATLWIGLLNPKNGQLTFSNGGHCPPVIVSKNGELRWIRDVSGPLVGVIDEAEFNECETTLEPGDLCLLYTDGVSEAMNNAKELFGEARIEQTMRTLAGKTPKETLKVFMQAIEAHRKDYVQSDDITMLAFCREGTH